jgi:ATP:corrinoid adenosyltransferase
MAIAIGLRVFRVQFLEAPDSSGEHFSAKPENVQLVITGRDAPPEVIDLAEVIEMKESSFRSTRALRLAME